MITATASAVTTAPASAARYLAWRATEYKATRRGTKEPHSVMVRRVTSSGPATAAGTTQTVRSGARRRSAITPVATAVVAAAANPGP